MAGHRGPLPQIAESSRKVPGTSGAQSATHAACLWSHLAPRITSQSAWHLEKKQQKGARHFRRAIRDARGMSAGPPDTASQIPKCLAPPE